MVPDELRPELGTGGARVRGGLLDGADRVHAEGPRRGRGEVVGERADGVAAGEVQLGALLEQAMSPNQYEANVSPKHNSERVEYAVKMPGRGGDTDQVVWLPIDAKFPVEDYERLLAAQDRADAPGMEEAARAIENRESLMARGIRSTAVQGGEGPDWRDR